MDFHTLTRRELQSLCKLNKIPANITNVAMADALQSLHNVVGIEGFLSVETANVVESVEVFSPQTRCRTSTVTRTTRRGGSKQQPPREVEESKNDVLQTPAVSRTSRKAPAASTRRNVSNQLSECEAEAKEECLVQNKYSTRRSTRLLTEKKSSAAAPRVEKAVKIDSFLDQGNSNAEVEDICNAFEKLDVVVIEEKEDKDCGANNLKQESDENPNLEISEVKTDDVEPESDGISSPSEEATNKSEDSFEISEVKIDDVKPESEEATHKSGEQDEDCDEVNNLKQDLEDGLKNSEVIDDEVCDLKPELGEISIPCEDEDIVQKIDLGDNFMSAMKEHNPVIVQEEHSDSDDTLSPCEDENLKVEENDFVMDQEENSDSLLESGVDASLGHEDTPCVDSEKNNQIAETSVDETVDAILAIDDDHSTMTKEVEDLKPELFTENNANEKKSDTIEVTVDAIPTIDDNSTMTQEVEDLKPELFNENNVNEKSETVDAILTIDDKSTMTEVVEEDLKPDLSNVNEIATSFKSITEEVEDHNPEFFTESNVNEKSNADLGPTHVAPFNKMLSVVSDDKENIVDEGMNRKKEKDANEKNPYEMSIRQLKKQLKALTLKSLNSKEEAAGGGKTRPALKALCENQMVGGETEN